MKFEYKIITRSSIGILTDEQFFAFCQENRDLQFERTKEGDIIIMPPTGGETSYRNIEVSAELALWNRSKKLGKAFDSSGGFDLPNGATRSPDASWIANERWDALTDEEKRKFPPLCPDFVVEIKSDSDSLKTLQEKMTEWMENGCRLAWLLDPKTETSYIYRSGKLVEEVKSFDQLLSGEDVLPGFALDLTLLK